jgi:hypothetical protein
MTVSRSDLEAKLREIEVIVDETKEQAKNTGVLLAIATVAAVGISFLAGRRRGKKAGGARVEVFRLK